MQNTAEVLHLCCQATDKPILKIYNQQFAQKKGSPVQKGRRKRPVIARNY